MVKLRDLTAPEMDMIFELLGRGDSQEGKLVIVMFWLALEEPELIQWVVDQALRLSLEAQAARNHGYAAMDALMDGIDRVLSGTHPSQRVML